MDTATDILNQQRQQQMDYKLRKFCDNYDVRVENDMRRAPIYNRMPPARYFVDPSDASICMSDYTMREEKLYTLSIPEGRLMALIELEERMSRYIHEAGGHDLLGTLLEKERVEATLRQQNEGIAKAYEQYSMLLHLAGYERKF